MWKRNSPNAWKYTKKEWNNRKKVRIKGENSTYFKVVYNIATVIGQVGNVCTRTQHRGFVYILFDSSAESARTLSSLWFSYCRWFCCCCCCYCCFLLLVLVYWCCWCCCYCCCFATHHRGWCERTDQNDHLIIISAVNEYNIWFHITLWTLLLFAVRISVPIVHSTEPFSFQLK